MKNNKWLTGLAVVVLGLFLAACGSGPSTSTEAGQDGDIANTDSNSGSQDTFTLTYSSVFPKATQPDEASQFMVEEFVEEVEKRTDGRVTFEKYYSNQLVPQDQVLDALASGTIDIGMTSPSFYIDLVPSSAFSNLPYWTHDDEFGYKMLRDSEIAEIIEKDLADYGVMPLMWGPTSEYGFVSTKPIRSFEDFKGKISRVGGGLWLPWLEAMGASGATVSVVESYEALQRGTIDLEPTPYHNIETFNYYEVTDYMIRPPILSSIFMVSYMSLNTFNSLPEDIQEIFLEVAREMEQKSLEGAKTINARNDELATKYGMEIITLSNEEVDKIINAAQASWDEYAKRNDNTARIVEILRDELEKRR